MKFLIRFISLTFLSVMLVSCETSGVDNSNTSLLPSQLSSFRNVPFTLTTAVIDGRSLNTSAYNTFHLLFSDSIVYGDNGTAHFYGGYTNSILGFDIVYIYKWSVGGPRDLNPCYLVGRWQLDVEDSSVTLKGAGSLFHFRSSFTAPVEEDPAVDKAWRLWDSDDSAFAELKQAGCLPDFVMTGDRLFSLVIPSSAKDSSGSHCAEYGSYGIDGKGDVYFYWTGAEYSYFPELNTDPASFLVRIAGSTKYRVNGMVLRLSGDHDGFFYRFVRN